MKMRCLFLLPVIVAVLALTCAAKQPAAPRFVDLKAADGTALKATYFAAGQGGPGVLLLHQCNRERKAWDGLAQSLAAAGINVLTMDFRGYGESGGTPHDKLTLQEAVQEQAKWPGDVDVALQYLRSQPGVKQNIVGLGGASCGVNQSIQAARRHSEVKALVLLSGPTDQQGRKFLHDSAHLPVLLSAADDDEFPGNAEIMEWLYSVSADPGSKFVRYPTGGHGTEMFAVQKELPALIVDWFVTTLIKTPGRAPVNNEGGAKRQSMLALIDEPGGAAQAGQMLSDARKRDPKAALFPEMNVNLIGYEHIQSGDTKGAVQIMKLNAAAYPDSPNVYDSLADAYLADGQNDLARESAQKALDHLGSDTRAPQALRDAIRNSAEQKLKQLGSGQR